MQHYLILILPGLLGGMINAIAGGGGIVMYPALLAAGLNPITANATASLVVLPGSGASAYGYRRELRKIPRAYWWLVIPCFFGAFIGSHLLTHTQPQTFEKLAPWFVLFAVVLLAVQSRLHHWITKQTKKRKIHWHTMPILYFVTFPLAIYAGYFGVGFGLMMLALLGFTALSTIHQMNGLKNVCGIVMSAISVAYFAHSGLIDWQSGAIMACGTTVGGYAGSRLSQRIPARLVHNLTVVIGLIICVVLFAKS